VINFIEFQQGTEESIQLRCLNDPRLGGQEALEERVGVGSVPTTVNERTSIGEQCIDSSLQPEDGSPMQSQYSTGVQPHDGATTELAHDGNMVVF
jgi:hypothetical protein